LRKYYNYKFHNHKFHNHKFHNHKFHNHKFHNHKFHNHKFHNLERNIFYKIDLTFYTTNNNKQQQQETRMTTIRMIWHQSKYSTLVLNRPLNATDNSRHPSGLIYEGDLPAGTFIKRYRMSVEELNGIMIWKGVGDLAAIIYDEDNELPDDYLKYCLQFLDLPENADLKHWVLHLDLWLLPPTEENSTHFFNRLRYDALYRSFDSLSDFIELLYTIRRLLLDKI
jgi:hypothetical protein